MLAESISCRIISFVKLERYVTSKQVAESAMYSASQVDSTTDACFLDYQLTDGPFSMRHTKYPVTLRPSAEDDAQYASQKACLRRSLGDFLKAILDECVFFTY